jgi:hypothetical protein
MIELAGEILLAVLSEGDHRYGSTMRPMRLSIFRVP